MIKALKAFDSLSQETRLRVFRLLVEAGPDGMAAGKIAEALDVPLNTLSFHLSHMAQAELVVSQREGRSIIYAAHFAQFNDLIRFMVQDCCRSDFARMHTDKKGGCAVIELQDCC